MAALTKALAMVGAAPEGHVTAVVTMRGLDAKSLQRWLVFALPGIEFWLQEAEKQAGRSWAWRARGLAERVPAAMAVRAMAVARAGPGHGRAGAGGPAGGGAAGLHAGSVGVRGLGGVVVGFVGNLR